MTSMTDQHPHHPEGFCTLATCDYSKAQLAALRGDTTLRTILIGELDRTSTVREGVEAVRNALNAIQLTDVKQRTARPVLNNGDFFLWAEESWRGSFDAALGAALDLALEDEEPLHVTLYFEEGDGNLQASGNLYTAGLHPGKIVFSDGYAVDREAVVGVWF
jgi:hypothetical protein